METFIATVGSFEAKTHLPQLLERVVQGEEFIITRRGKAIARLVSVEVAQQKNITQTISAMKELRAGATLGGLSWQDLRDEGRK
jgi:prevent-host-death family protein